MKEVQVISGPDAIARMRTYRNIPGAFFRMSHVTWNNKNRISNGLRHVSRCRIRPALPKEVRYPISDLFLPYIDIDADEPRMAYKKLITEVAFPPDFIPMKVQWYNR